MKFTERSGSPERYIEAYVWSDETIEKYR